MRLGRTTVLAAVTTALVLGGCTAEDREQIADTIQGAASEAASAVEEAAESAVDEVVSEEPTEPASSEEAAPTEEEPAPEPTEEPTEDAAAEVDDDGVPWWLWVVLALLAVALVSAIAALRRRHVAAAARRDRMRDAALAEADWLLGVAREHASGVDAAARARDVRLRLDRLNDDLQQLRSTGKQQVAELATGLQTSARQLADALVARYDDVAAGRGAGSNLDIEELAARVQAERDALATALGRRPGT